MGLVEPILSQDLNQSNRTYSRHGKGKKKKSVLGKGRRVMERSEKDKWARKQKKRVLRSTRPVV